MDSPIRTSEDQNTTSPAKLVENPKKQVSKSFGNISDDYVPRKNTAVFGSFSLKPVQVQEDLIKMTATVGKKSKMLFYTQREITLFSNGTLAYKGKSKKDVSKTIVPESIERSKQNLTITFNHKKLNFKFSNAIEAKKW